MKIVKIILTLLTFLTFSSCGAAREFEDRAHREIDAALKNLLTKVNARLSVLKTYTLLYAQICETVKQEHPDLVKVKCPSGRQGEEPFPSVPPTKVITKCGTQIMVRDQKANVFYEQDGQTYMGELEPNVSYQTTTNCVLSVDNTGE